MRILLSAFACNPEQGSEPGVGWAWAYQLAKAGHEVSVLTREYHRSAIEGRLRELGLSNLHFEYVGVRHLPYWMPGLGVYPYYMCWQWNAYLRAKQLHAERSFEIVHHVTYAVFRNTSYLHRLGAPFIFGPVGGGERSPRALRVSMSRKGRRYEALRDLVNLLPRLNPMWRAMLRRSTRIIVKTEDTRACLPRSSRGKATVALENMVSEQPYLAGEPIRVPTFRLLYAGTLRPLKGLHLAVRAMVLVRGRAAVRLTIVGKGEEESRLKEEVRQLGLEQSIEFVSWIPKSDVLALHATHDAFLFPSLHDSGGTVVMEAIAHGKPVICLDLGGPAVTVDQHCARIVNTRDRTEEQVIRGIADAILNLYYMPSAEWEEMRRAAIRRAKFYSPEQVIARVYGALLEPLHLCDSSLDLICSCEDSGAQLRETTNGC